MTTTPTVIEYVLRRLHEIGVDDVFGVPGDFAFPVQDAIVAHPDLNWIGCCNELNAGYAADGYARIKGVAAVSTTYGVGELSAIAAVAGSYAEHLPVFHLTGMPNLATQGDRTLVHHTLGNGEFELTSAEPLPCPASESRALRAATDAVVAALSAAPNTCVLPGVLLDRLRISDLAVKFIEAAGLPFATMFADKSVIDEHHPNYVGMYDGRLMDEQVREFVESADAVISLGTMQTDFNTGAFTARLDPARVIDIGLHRTKVGATVYQNVELADLLRELTARDLKPHAYNGLRPASLGPATGADSDPIAADTLYPRWENFLRPDDIVVAETGTASMGLVFAHLPTGARFYNQTLWGSIGWATPAALGAAVAAPDRRVVLITGEGSHQLTAQEICQFHRLGLRPIIFVLNNSGYLIERLLCKDPTLLITTSRGGTTPNFPTH